jgi:hypothetical protein
MTTVPLPVQVREVHERRRASEKLQPLVCCNINEAKRKELHEILWLVCTVNNRMHAGNQRREPLRCRLERPALANRGSATFQVVS